MGNVFQKSLRELMASPGMAAACRLLVERRTIGTCGACTFHNLCQGGCMGLAMDHTGDVRNVDDFCQYRKSAYVRAFDELLIRSEEGEQGKPI
jgi:radical SAM protein with 4Fe4S-binding SPASM domain